MREIQLHMANCMDVMGELLQSGFLAANESTLERLRKLSDVSGQCGLLRLAEQMKELYIKLSGMKHQMKRSKEEEKALLELFCEIRNYLELGERKSSYDEAKTNLKGDWKDEKYR